MLVLSRKQRETVRVGNGGKVTVLEIRGDSVRLGFEFPTDVGVHREEVWQRIQAEQETEGAE